MLQYCLKSRVDILADLRRPVVAYVCMCFDTCTLNGKYIFALVGVRYGASLFPSLRVIGCTAFSVSVRPRVELSAFHQI